MIDLTGESGRSFDAIQYAVSFFNGAAMSDYFDWKKFQFITEVQTALIANAINKSLDDDAKERRHIFSATGALINMDDAFYAAERIPNNLSAHKAACEFIDFTCSRMNGERTSVPIWFQRF